MFHHLPHLHAGEGLPARKPVNHRGVHRQALLVLQWNVLDLPLTTVHTPSRLLKEPCIPLVMDLRRCCYRLACAEWELNAV